MATREETIRALIADLPDDEMLALADRLVAAASARGNDVPDRMVAQLLASAFRLMAHRTPDPMLALGSMIRTLLSEIRRSAGLADADPFPGFVAQLADCSVGEILLVAEEKARLDLVYRVATGITEAVEIRSGVWHAPRRTGATG